jgi:hypothetical protein
MFEQLTAFGSRDSSGGVVTRIRSGIPVVLFPAETSPKSLHDQPNFLFMHTARYLFRG